MTATTNPIETLKYPIETPKYDREVYQPGRVANYLLDMGERDGIFISPMKLQKLVYNAYGWVWARLGQKLFEERIEAWEHGPVIPSLYHELKRFGWAPITEKCRQFHPFTVGHTDPEFVRSIKDRKICQVLDMVWEVYKDFTAIDLRAQTHIENTPWWNARYPAEGEAPKRGVVIDDDEIKSHFSEKIAEYFSN